VQGPEAAKRIAGDGEQVIIDARRLYTKYVTAVNGSWSGYVLIVCEEKCWDVGIGGAVQVK